MRAKLIAYGVAAVMAGVGLLLARFGGGLKNPSLGVGLETLGRLVLALGLAAGVGAERESRDKPAGIRTVAIVGVGACLFALIGIHVAGVQAGLGFEDRDAMARIMQGIITGIGFLGAGTIIKDKFEVEGLTTAASLWAVAGVGVACGLGYTELALLATAVILVVLIALRGVDTLMHPHR